MGGTFHFGSMELAASVVVRDDKSFELWHKRMGHPSAKVVGLLPAVSNGVSEFSNKACDVCLRAKQTRLSFPISENKTKGIFDMVHCDIWGPYRTPTHSGARYFLTIVDDYSRGVWLYLMSQKSEAPTHLKNFLAMAARQFETHVRVVRSDKGSEFLCLSEFFKQQGIVHETSCVGTLQQNGRVERKHRHILNVARALRFQANLPIEFWGECVLTAAYLINRTPSMVLKGMTPYERLYNEKPSYNHVKVLGSLCYAHDQSHKGDKFASRSRRCVFIGYPYGKKGWRLYDLEKNQFFVSRDVVFIENEFPYKFEAEEENTEEEEVFNLPFLFVENEEEDRRLSQSGGTNPIRPEIDIGPILSPSAINEEVIGGSSSSRLNDEELQHEVVVNIVQPPPTVISPVTTTASTSTAVRQSTATTVPPIQEEELGRGKRQKTQSVKIKEFVVNTGNPKSKSTPSSSSTSGYPIANYVDCERFSPQHQAYLAAITSGVEPKSFKQAVKDERWNNAMSSEIDAQERNHSWTIEDLPEGKEAIGCKWVYKLKYKSDGTLERHKARLVALGNKQVEGVDYGETFAPVAKMGTVRLFLDTAVKNNWDVHQMDVYNAFLHGDLEEEIYMKLPPGFKASDPAKVCRLRKSLYGLKQSPRCWFSKLSTSLKEYGFEQNLLDYSLFTLDKDGAQLRVLVYVDDLVISSSNLKIMQNFKDYLSSCFHMKDLGPLKYFLGIEIARNSTGMYLSQRKYALDIVSDTGLLGAKPVSFPLDTNHHLALSKSKLLQEPEPYRRLVGRLIYLAVTRPDLAYCVHVLAQFMQAPREDHWAAALRVVRYLKNNPGQGILLRADTPFHFTGWCDSDYASCPLTRRSVTGYFIQLGGSPISWKTKKQKTVSRSSAEAEYRALAFLTQELIWLKRILAALGVKHKQSMSVWCDSKAAIHIATNPVFHERTKHVEVDCHFVRDEVLSKNICLNHVCSDKQLADIFTKPLGRQEYEQFCFKLGIQDLHAPT